MQMCRQTTESNRATLPGITSSSNSGSTSFGTPVLPAETTGAQVSGSRKGQKSRQEVKMQYMQGLGLKKGFAKISDL